MSLFNELKRRNVFKVATAYIVVSWLIIQVIGSIVPIIEAPEWVAKAILVVLLAGLPIALLFAWAFELTPDGIKKESEVDRSESITPQTSSKINLVIIASLVLIIGGFAYDKFFGDSLTSQLVENQLDDSRKSPKDLPISDSATTNSISDKSIAVLPFIPLSADENDGYFGKGIAEELLNALAKFPELKVAARTSAFSFGGKDIDLREVAAKLGVAHVLEGSVRSAGDKVRVTAQLIRASDGFHLWSQTYDRNMVDIFKVQDDIVREINRTLQIRLGVGVGAGRAAPKQVDPVAYQNYLRGLELWGLRADHISRRDAIRAFQIATVQDSNFTDGWAAYGVSLVHSDISESGMKLEQHRAAAKHALDTALELDADNVRALAGSGVYYLSKELDIERGTSNLIKALDLAPNSAEARYGWTFIPALMGGLPQVHQAFDQALSLDPLNQTIKRVYAENIGAMGDYDGISELIKSCVDCTKEDQARMAASLYMSARRNGSDDQVRETAAKYNALLLEDKSHNTDSIRKFLVKRMLVISSPPFVERLLGGAPIPEKELKKFRSLSKEYASFKEPFVWAIIGETDFVLDLLERAYNSDLGDLYWIIQPMGRDVWPDSLRRDPRFHTFWQNPGMPELAAMLRSKGKLAGLPLPLEGNN